MGANQQVVDYPSWLRNRRLEAGLTAEELAELAGLSRSTISRAEARGRTSAASRRAVEAVLTARRETTSGI